MYYLDEKTYNKISKSIEIHSISSFSIEKINKFKFDSGIEEYNDFLFYEAFQVAEAGVGCRFITVDADIEYEKGTDKFYLKNGFKYNENYKKNKGLTISMRRDVYGSLIK